MLVRIHAINYILLLNSNMTHSDLFHGELLDTWGMPWNSLSNLKQIDLYVKWKYPLEVPDTVHYFGIIIFCFIVEIHTKNWGTKILAQDWAGTRDTMNSLTQHNYPSKQSGWIVKLLNGKIYHWFWTRDPVQASSWFIRRTEGECVKYKYFIYQVT